ncbi:hypothetical protein GCM10010112_40350 [Actinoplanes lobatus]|uniref:Uncharacterized protein n=1 Tax=Actinoplanes lobatus TaxID=113568 RepID=A0A7W7HNL9_9ACTN|nr:hypothetical protein [Actinoplanes lobatus]MBB4753848.1 hypothetical protein [Actinoplanes lobatus]GGN72259.1 hypothetical protein GCM10010112_40350 [Actinoplanes lobatus]GIE41998.1 hypothetical protein Alo02nite_48960 [Actinoplanes lobatus]
MTFLSRLRRLPILRGVADAVSHADTGPYAGAPRDPDLRIGDEQGYSTVRYTTGRIAHIATSVSEDVCPRCGSPMAENHEIQQRDGSAVRLRTGSVRACRTCDPDSWLLRSQMSAVTRAREAARRNVV